MLSVFKHLIEKVPCRDVDKANAYTLAAATSAMYRNKNVVEYHHAAGSMALEEYRARPRISRFPVGRVQKDRCQALPKRAYELYSEDEQKETQLRASICLD
jgi:hypothetical protein